MKPYIKENGHYMTRHTGYISLVSELNLGRMAESSKGVAADDDRSLETLWGAQLNRTSLGELRNYL
ncbi:hypothetical protein IEQ34_012329 [Dendrobium chrysotoxum]|uniref:Uncharacterized protein n=1 Tax=Dendrobium chrysotoxum TaxID=161865 RepID=A0AAV7GWB3_DENCH|nr:hypothetical protein IEQ34_012329 [Dendrobium chrysotoxum]